MNKIYKVIWSKVKACYVVVSELAKRHSKGKSLKSAASLVALTAILAFLPVQVNATDVAPGDSIAQLKALNTKVDGGWTLAVARKTSTEGEATASGAAAPVAPGAKVTLGAGRGIKLTQDGTNIDIGLKFIDMDPAGYPINDAKASGGASLAVGQNSVADGHQATAVGYDSHAAGQAFAGGTSAAATGSYAVAIGSNAKANGQDAIAIGIGKRFGRNPSVYKKAESDSAIAIGGVAYVDDKSEAAVALGASAAVTDSPDGLALGSKAAVLNTETGVALGSYSQAQRKGGAYGYNPLTGTVFTDDAAVAAALGKTNDLNNADKKIDAAEKTVKDAQAKYDNDRSNVNRRALRDAKQALETAKGEKNILLSTYKSTLATVSVGDASTGRTRQITNVAAGREDTDAVNVAQLKALNQKVDDGAVHYFSVKADDSAAPADTNWNNDGAKNANAIAVGPNAIARATGSLALGYGAQTGDAGLQLNAQHATDSIAIGTSAFAEGMESIAIGKKSHSNGQAVVIGSGATVKTDSHSAVVIGYQAKTSSGNGVVIGGNANESGGNGVAIGVKSTVKQFGGVAIGGVGSNMTPVDMQASLLGGQIPGAVTLEQNGVALGSQALAGGESAIAIGLASHAAGENALSVGELSYAGKLASAVGYQARALGEGSHAQGFQSVTTGSRGIALGALSMSVGSPWISGGAIQKQDLGSGVALGPSSLSGGYGAAIGRDASANGFGSTALGAASKVALPDITDKAVQDKLDTDAAFKTLIETRYASELKKFSQNGNWHESLKDKTLLALSREYLYAERAKKEGTLRGTAIGLQTVASVPLAVALGAYSKADRAGYEQETIAPFSGADLKDVTMGALSVGFKDKDGEYLRQIIHVGDGTDDTDAVNLRQLKALSQKVDDGAVHYYSVKSDKQAAGTNYANDGAKAADSMVIGISSSISEKAKNSTVLGNNNTLANQPNARGVERDSENNSIVVGQNLTVEGARNAVFGTDYQNGTDKLLTHVAGERNTVIGVGNLVGYTAERVGTEWKYTKFKGHGDDENVVVGLTNTVNGGGVVVGTNTTVSAYGGVAFGHHNTVSGDEDKGVALGNDLNVSGYGALAVGTGSTAKGDDTIALGVESKAEAELAASMGYDSQAKASGSLALGAWSSAEAKQAVALGYDSQAKAVGGVALGAKSVANREKDVLGYDPVTGAVFANDAAVAAALGKTTELTAAETNISNAQEAVNAAQQAYDADQSDANKTALRDAKKALTQAESAKGVLLSPYKSTLAAVSVGDASKGRTRQITNVAAGAEDTDAVNVAQLKALNQKVDDGAVHYFSVKADDSAAPADTNWNNDGATGAKAIAIGRGAKANGNHSIALGSDGAEFSAPKTTGAAAIAIGSGAEAGVQDISIGLGAKATGGFGVAIGRQSEAKASTAVAMAYGAKAEGANSLAIGILSDAKTDDSAAYGREAKALGDVSLAVGAQSKAGAAHTAVFGAEATTDATAWNGTAIGRSAYIGKQAPDGTTPNIGVSNNYFTPVDDDTVVAPGKETMNSTAVGFGAKAFGYQDTALGAGAEAFDTNTVSIGVMSKAIGHYANALGKQARAEGKDSVAIGHWARSIGESSMALGDYAITSTLDGRTSVTKSAAIGSHARAASDNSVALGTNSLANIADDVATKAYLSNEAFAKENGVVSVGNEKYKVGDTTVAKNYRRITNVAGGAADNDAVNVAQLKAVDKKVAVVFDDKKSLMSIDAKIKHEILEDPGRFPEGEGQSIALGKDAYAYMQGGRKAQGVLFGMKKATGAIAIGQNAKALSHSIAIGNRLYAGDMGDVKISPSDYNVENGSGVASTLLGNNSYAGGTLSTLVGSYSIMSTSYPGGHQKAYMQNAGAVSVGALNSIESATAKQGTSFFGQLPDDKSSGVANSIVGLANRAYNANGALIYGAGNEITNSIASVTAPAAKGSVKAAAENLRKAIKTNPGGAVLAIGGGNKADLAVRSQLIGVANTLTGTSETPSEYNMLDGFNNTGTNVKHITLMGSENTVSDTTGAILLGDKRKLTGANGSIVLGAADTEKELTVKDAVLIGHNADVQKAGGVALGAQSVASVDKGVAGYDPAAGDHANDTTGTWKATAAAVSVGKAATPTGAAGSSAITRQITNVAAGTQDTDAVNVAQLKAVKTKMDTEVEAARTHYYSVEDKGFHVANYDNKGAKGGMALAAGAGTVANGTASTATGAFNQIQGDGVNGFSRGFQGATSSVYGSFNTIAGKNGVRFDGVANSIVGVANRTENANAALVFGAGNKVTNSYRKVSAFDQDKAKEALQKAITTGDNTDMIGVLGGMVKESGGAVLALGGANTADYALLSKVVGVGNTLTGAEGKESKLNMIDGFGNIGKNINNVTMIGSKNTVQDTNGALVLGDNRQLTGADNSIILGSGVAVDPTGTTAPAPLVTNKKEVVIIGHNANSNYDNAVVLGSNSTATLKATAVTKAKVEGIEYSGFKGSVTGPGMQVSVGAAGKERQIKHVGAGEISKDSTDAINGSQLYAVASKMQEAATAAKTTVEAGDNVTVTAGSTPNSYKISAKDTTLKEGNSALKLSGKTLSMEIEDTSGKKVTGSVDLAAIAGEVDTNTTYTMTGTENTDNTTTISLEGSDGKKQSVTVATKDTRNTVKAGTNVTVDEAANADGSSTYTVNVKADGKVEAGNTGIVNGGTVYNETRVTKDGNYVKKDNTAGQNLSALDGQVKQNADNITNLGNTINNMGNQINNLDGRVNKVGAGAAALAAMHPLDFDPDDKWNVSAGYGSYKGSHAGAIGAFYRPDENTMFNIGASVGGGENMVNAGVTFALDRKSHITTSRTAMAREIMDLRKEITELKAARANGNWMLDPEMTKLFPDVPENHWAYEYIAKLAGNGIIKGYPDGSFAGNRMMTRYEFAALLYRAMENGANVDARALKEFAPEMGRIRVDRVYGKDNDRNKIERVRVNNENTQERDTYGSKIQIAAK